MLADKIMVIQKGRTEKPQKEMLLAFIISINKQHSFSRLQGLQLADGQDHGDLTHGEVIEGDAAGHGGDTEPLRERRDAAARQPG